MPRLGQKSAFLSVFALSLACLSLVRAEFNQAKEFPNYWLPPEWRGKALNAPPKQVIRQSRKQMEAALASIFRRMTVPVVDGKTVRHSTYFPELLAEIRKIDKTAKLYPSGGVVRSAISYLYEEMHRAAERGEDPQKLLARIATDTKPISSLDVRGVGSDFDVLIRSKQSDQVIRKVLDVTNSSETSYGSTLGGGARKRALFTIGDAKAYDQQISRSTAQGGADIDFLAFDVETGKFVEPPQVADIVDNLVQGRYRYLPPLPGAIREAPTVTTVRGGRGLIELPFLSLEDDTQFKTEVKSLRQSVAAGNKVSAKAIEQFDKAVRNARLSGANNRFYRSADGSLEAEFLGLANDLKNQEHRTLLPEFVDRFDLERKPPLPDSLKSALVSYANFTKLAPNAEIFHGTPNVENGLSIMRKSFLLSTSQQGTAIYGRGTYSSPQRALAEAYAGPNGMVFRLKVKEHPNLRILDVTKLTPAQKLEVLPMGGDLHEVLARKYGVDIILNGHVLIQNAEAISPPGNVLADLVESVGKSLRNEQTAITQLSQNLQQYQELEEYLMAMDPTYRPDEKIAAQTLDLIAQKLKPGNSFFDEMNAYQKVLARLSPEAQAARAKERNKLLRVVAENYASAVQAPQHPFNNLKTLRASQSFEAFALNLDPTFTPDTHAATKVAQRLEKNILTGNGDLAVNFKALTEAHGLVPELDQKKLTPLEDIRRAAKEMALSRMNAAQNFFVTDLKSLAVMGTFPTPQELGPSLGAAMKRENFSDALYELMQANEMDAAAKETLVDAILEIEKRDSLNFSWVKQHWTMDSLTPYLSRRPARREIAKRAWIISRLNNWRAAEYLPVPEPRKRIPIEIAVAAQRSEFGSKVANYIAREIGDGFPINEYPELLATLKRLVLSEDGPIRIRYYQDFLGVLAASELRADPALKPLIAEYFASLSDPRAKEAYQKLMQAFDRPLDPQSFKEMSSLFLLGNHGPTPEQLMEKYYREDPKLLVQLVESLKPFPAQMWLLNSQKFDPVKHELLKKIVSPGSIEAMAFRYALHNDIMIHDPEWAKKMLGRKRSYFSETEAAITWRLFTDADRPGAPALFKLYEGSLLEAAFASIKDSRFFAKRPQLEQAFNFIDNFSTEEDLAKLATLHGNYLPTRYLPFLRRIKDHPAVQARLAHIDDPTYATGEENEFAKYMRDLWDGKPAKFTGVDPQFVNTADLATAEARAELAPKIQALRGETPRALAHKKSDTINCPADYAGLGR